MPMHVTEETRRRIVRSAANLFAKGGYNGTSTREIAATAKVNQATLFRHFATKRDLYTAVVRFKLDRVHFRRDLLAEVAGATDARAALASAFELIAAMFAEQHDVFRLIQFCSLELGRELDPLLRAYIHELIEVVIEQLQPWIDNGQLQYSNTRTVVLTFFAIVLNYQCLFRLFAEDLPSLPVTLDIHEWVYGAVAPN
jgi:AcrR family transcriptional regulator